jgi:hypothetical protein
MTAITALCVAAIAGCGAASAPSAPNQIRSVSRSYVQAIEHNDARAACRLTTDRRDCIAKFAAARAIGLLPEDSLTGRERKNIASMKITVNGDHARSSRGNRYVRRDGHWLIVL